MNDESVNFSLYLKDILVSTFPDAPPAPLDPDHVSAAHLLVAGGHHPSLQHLQHQTYMYEHKLPNMIKQDQS